MPPEERNIPESVHIFNKSTAATPSPLRGLVESEGASSGLNLSDTAANLERGPPSIVETSGQYGQRGHADNIDPEPHFAFHFACKLSEQAGNFSAFLASTPSVTAQHVVYGPPRPTGDSAELTPSTSTHVVAHQTLPLSMSREIAPPDNSSRCKCIEHLNESSRRKRERRSQSIPPERHMRTKIHQGIRRDKL